MEIVLEDGSGVAIDWVTGRSYSREGDGSMHNQAYVRVGESSVKPPSSSVAAVMVDTEKVFLSGRARKS